MRRAAPANWSNLPNRTVAFLHGLGHFQTPMRLHLMSALHLEADILLQRVDVRFWPIVLQKSVEGRRGS